jgi:succinylarginine dihydrolase
MLEFQFDGLAGPTHHYAGLSLGNVASQRHAGELSNPRAAALQGLEKARQVRDLGVVQFLLPPQPRPDVRFLRRLGFTGSDASVLERALTEAPRLLHAASSASSMWAANAATVFASEDTLSGKLELVPANLVSQLHRSLEAEMTQRLLAHVFADEQHFVVHAPLPACEAMADEGAANHLRLVTSQGVVNLLGWGRAAGEPAPARYPARQTREASAALARLAGATSALLWQQHPRGIDAGAFHSDVLAVSCGSVLLLHELAFTDVPQLLEELRKRLGDELCVVLAREAELPAIDAVQAYPFNSQLLSLAGGELVLLAPLEAQANDEARRFLERAESECPRIKAIRYIDVNGSMRNGGGPACLRLRVPLRGEQALSLPAHLRLDEPLRQALEHIISTRYRDRLELADMADPAFVDETRTALDEITQALGVGALYDFQRG